ncbi:MAG: hypothetical protein ACT4PV_09530 [Planctomycetaceae bacterium]
MCPACSYCGAITPQGALACPQCGSDAETGWREEDSVDGLDLPADLDESTYQELLEEEGLVEGNRRRRLPKGFLLAFVAALALSGVLWLIFLLKAE